MVFWVVSYYTTWLDRIYTPESLRLAEDLDSYTDNPVIDQWEAAILVEQEYDRIYCIRKQWVAFTCRPNQTTA